MQAVGNITLTLGRSFAWQSAKLWQDPKRRASIMRDFWLRVNRTDAKACWLWTGHVSDRGYGIFWLALGPDAQRVRANRFAYFMSRGDIPEGLEVCHTCDVPACVNPSHLFLGTRLDNHLDAVCKGRKKAWGTQKLTAGQVREIRARAATGELHRIIAADYGIARNSVGQIASRKTWTHLAVLPSEDPREVCASGGQVSQHSLDSSVGPRQFHLVDGGGVALVVDKGGIVPLTQQLVPVR